MILAVIAFVIAFLVSGLAKGNGVGVYNKDPDYRMKSIDSKLICGLEEELKKIGFNDIGKVKFLIDEKYNFSQGYSLYVVDADGNVIVDNNTGIKTIDVRGIKDGKREYSDGKNSELFKVIGCEYLKDGYFLYYIYNGYGQDDSVMLIWTLIGFIILFFIFLWGRVSYISRVKASVQVIAEGDLSHRVPVKYKNELRELAEDINHLAEELEKEDKKRSEFLTNISHDLRTPLTTMLGYTDMIKKGKYDSKEEFDKYISILERKGSFLKNMLEDFFDYSKLSSKDMNLNLERLELNELARQLLEDERDIFRERSLELSVIFSKEPVYIDADPELIARAIENLLSNAVKYSKPNTQVRIIVSKEKRKNNSFAVISINNLPKDVISEEEVSSFFERLYKKDQSRKDNGSGLGLSIVKDIAKLHGGFVQGLKEGENLVFSIGIKESVDA